MLIRNLVLAVCACAMAACSTLPEDVSMEQQRWLLGGAGTAGLPAPAPDSLPRVNILELTPEMQEFAESAVEGHGDEIHKIVALLSALVQPGALALEYDPSATYTAAEVFDKRRANCLSFTSIYIAMARHVGLRAAFNEVDVPPIWDLLGAGTFVMYRHVNVVVTPDQGWKKVVDLDMEEYDASYEQEIITDRLASAQYYNNKAVEFLFAQNAADAFLHLVAAISLEPEVAYLWSNLGSLYRRLGNLPAAEAAFNRAMQLDRGELVAISNAARLQRELGNIELAQELEARAERFRMLNPYYRYNLAVAAVRAGDYAAAEEHLKFAVGTYEKEHRFHFLLGSIYSLTGDRARAEVSLNRAKELSTDPDQVTGYQRKIDLLMSRHM